MLSVYHCPKVITLAAAVVSFFIGKVDASVQKKNFSFKLQKLEKYYKKKTFSTCSSFPVFTWFN
jgi:hypothetical protein